MKKKLFIILGVLAVVTVIVLLKVADNRFKDKQLTDVIIDINLNNSDELITESDIEEIIYQGRDSIMSLKVGELDLPLIEEAVRNNPYVLDADAYINVDATLIIDVMQRKPIMRVFNTKNDSYYVDLNGVLMPLHPDKSVPVVVVSGKITQAYDSTLVLRSIDSVDYKMEKTLTTLERAYHLATMISKDTMLSNLVSQIYFVDKSNIELIPTIGEQTIIFGDVCDAKSKLEKLKFFYRKAYKMCDFAKYKSFDLRFENQIVSKYKQ